MFGVGFACKYFPCIRCASSTNLSFREIDMFRELIFTVVPHFKGTRWRGWLRHCATSRKVAGSIPDGVTVIFN